MSPLERFELSEHRKNADLAMLRQLASTRPAHRPRFATKTTVVAGSVALLIGGGVATAAVIEHLTPTQAKVSTSGRCYTELSTNFSDGFPGVSVGNAHRPGQDAQAVPQTLLDECSVLWQHGELTPGQRGSGDYSDSANLPVPDLTVCVLPNGQAAVFPGHNICPQLGLPAIATN